MASVATRSWTYAESLEWLYGRQALGIKLGLDKVRKLLAAVGDPQDAFESIHIAGTNGKGSVTRLMAGVLQRAGYKTGLTTSPHLVHFTERIEVQGRRIGQDDVARLLGLLRAPVAQLDHDGQQPTFFEIVTALAFLHFQQEGVQWAVVETGMGGRLDATNVLQPRLTIITNVDYDHQAHLGATLQEIAFEKGGIMKAGVPCITGATGVALDILKARSRDVQCPMSILGEDYHVVAGDALTLQRPTGETHYAVGMAGAHQRRNAALVVAASEALRANGLAIPERAVRDALAQTTHPGRLETVRVPVRQIDPTTRTDAVVEVLLDGAHNIGAAHALRNHLARTQWSGFHLVVGFCADKDWRDAVDQWAPLAEQVWCVPVRNPRSLQPTELAAHVAPSGIPAHVHPSAAAALQAAARAGAQRILVAGSLFLAGEARAHLTGETSEEIRGSQ